MVRANALAAVLQCVWEDRKSIVETPPESVVVPLGFWGSGFMEASEQIAGLGAASRAGLHRVVQHDVLVVLGIVARLRPIPFNES
jgi:hypothetical protein